MNGSPIHSAVRTSALRRRRSQRALTLLELLVVLGVISVLATLTVPELLKTLRRARLEGGVQDMTRVMMQARAEAIYRGAPVIVTPDRRGDRDFLVAWVDVDEDGKFDGTIAADGTFQTDDSEPFRSVDYTLYEWILPQRSPDRKFANLYFWGANDGTPAAFTSTVDQLNTKPNNVTDPDMKTADGYGDWQRAVVFLDDGRVADTGAIRVGMGPWGGGDRSVNFLELRILSQASGQVELRKWIPSPHGEYEPKGFESTSYSQHGIAYEWEWF